MIERTFRTVLSHEYPALTDEWSLDDQHASQGLGWGDLYRWKRILLVSEAGAGKTHECKHQRSVLFGRGQPAFRIDLPQLTKTDKIHELINDEYVARFHSWYHSQSETATFFLDSLDELSFTTSDLEIALRRFEYLIGHQHNNVQTIITTRPTKDNFDLLKTHLPVSKESVPENPRRDEFAKTVMGENQGPEPQSVRPDPKDWITVKLEPLNTLQVRQLAIDKKVSNVDEFISKVADNDMQDFLSRPLDVINLIEDWRINSFSRNQRMQIEASINRRLSPPDPGQGEPEELSIDFAHKGARKLALSLLLLNRSTLRTSGSSINPDNSENTVEPSEVLTDWKQKEKEALLQLPLFEVSSPRCVKIHHRSVLEYLGATELSSLLKTSLGISRLIQILFSKSGMEYVARSDSIGAMAAWLAIGNPRIYEILRDHEPIRLMISGDPESLSIEQRKQVLLAYIDKHGNSNSRVSIAQNSQLKRFASEELGTIINEVWPSMPLNIGVRFTLLGIIRDAKIDACSDIAFQVASDSQVLGDERIAGLEALIATGDSRVATITDDIVTNNGQWSPEMAAHALNSLFPKYCTIDQFCQAISWIADSNNLKINRYPLQWAVSKAELNLTELEHLRNHLFDLASEGIKWNKKIPRVSSKRPELATLLAIVCKKGLKVRASEEWLSVAIHSVHLFDQQHGSDHIVVSLRDELQKLNAESYETLRLIEVKLLFKLSSLDRLYYTFDQLFFRDETLSFDIERDVEWIKKGFVGSVLDLSQRERLLDCVKYLINFKLLPLSFLSELKQLVSSQPHLLDKVEAILTSLSTNSNAEDSSNAQTAQQDVQTSKRSKAFESWQNLFDEITSDINQAFSTEREKVTAYNLWYAMVTDSEDNKATVWNRRYIEEYFGKDVADRLRSCLMRYWKNQNPLLPSERPKNERQGFPNNWLMGLAGIYAEAEDENWVRKLTAEEAALAVRYSMVAYTSIPSWLNDIAGTYPEVVRNLIGIEISFELKPKFKRSYLLQEIGYADSRVASLFVAQLLDWLKNVSALKEQMLNRKETTSIVHQVIKIIVKHGTDEQIHQLTKLSMVLLEKELGRNFVGILLSTLLRISPELGLNALERKLENVKVSKRSSGVHYIASVFDDRFDPINLNEDHFTPRQLKSLLCLVFSHVRMKDDVHRQGLYSPDTRDDAQTARRRILTAFNNTRGEEAHHLRLKAAGDPLFQNPNDNQKSVISAFRLPEKTEDFTNERDVVEFMREQRLPLRTNEAIFNLLKERIDDIREMLKQDLSPRRIWDTLNHENLLRTAIAIELNRHGSSMYTVTQEDQTVDEKRTDIRLRSRNSSHEAVIEIKRYERNSKADLMKALQKQLVGNYLQPETRRAGILLITLSSNTNVCRSTKTTNDSVRNETIEAEDRVEQLKKEVMRIKDDFDGELLLDVELLDLRSSAH